MYGKLIIRIEKADLSFELNQFSKMGCNSPFLTKL